MCSLYSHINPITSIVILLFEIIVILLWQPTRFMRVASRTTA